MASFSLLQESLPHTANVVVHVAFGTLALGMGLVALLVRKGGRLHLRFGRVFLWCLAVVIATAILGVVAFGFRAFLGVITLLAAYQGYYGYRTLQTRSTGPQAQDAIVSIVGLAAVALFLWFLESTRTPWSPVVVYPTLGTLGAVALYDLVRFAFPKRWLQHTWFYEHLIKMLGAYNAVVSAFAGTVLAAWQPYSQILPSALGLVAMAGFIAYFRTRPRPSRMDDLGIPEA
jgi:uncharacterized membrane protein